MQTKYGLPAILLHWLVALLIIGGWVLGQVMVDMKVSPTKLQYFAYHKWIGVTVFALALARLAWRHIRPPPPPLPGQPAWQLRAAAITHIVLYVLMFVIPLTGWLFSSAAGFQTVYLGVLPLPDLLAKGSSLKDVLQETHHALNALLLVLVVLHVLAALKHGLLDRDGTLARMSPFGRRDT